MAEKEQVESGGSGDKVRVYFDFLPGALEKLDSLVEESGAPTRGEVIRRALAVYTQLFKHRGKEIQVEVIDEFLRID